MSFNKFEHFSNTELVVLATSLSSECLMYRNMAEDGDPNADEVIDIIVSMSEELLVEVKTRRAVMGAEIDQLIAEINDDEN